MKEYLCAVFERYYDLKRNSKELNLYNVYSIVNVVIKMSVWSINIHDDEFYESEIYDYYCKVEKELDLVDEGELVKLMTDFEKASFYLIKLDKKYLKNFIKMKYTE